jgi:uncharacterized protein YgiB involved in biofilm formation
MTSHPSEPLPQIRIIRRKQVHQSLLLSSVIATLLLSGCSDEPNTQSDLPVEPSPTVPALFYETTEQCKTHTQKQQDQYAAQMKAYQQKQRTTAPSPPVLKPTDCAAQMAAARQEHDRHAPVYQNRADCQAEGVQCEPTPAGHSTVGYRPSYGGTYIYTHGNGYPSSTSASRIISTSSGLSGSSARSYESRTVYRSRNPGEVVTPQGEVLSNHKSGFVSAPSSSRLAAPSRPKSHAARGTITGRSSNGFGSTYKSTGRGGK